MLDLSRKPFAGYVYLNQLENEVPDTDQNKAFILSCNYAIRLLKEGDRNVKFLYTNINKIIRENIYLGDQIYEECFWKADRIIDVLKKLINLFNRFVKRPGISGFETDVILSDKIKKIRDNQTHLEEKLLQNELTSYFRISYHDQNGSIVIKLDNESPYYSMTKRKTENISDFNPKHLVYKIADTLNRKNNASQGEIEIDFLSIENYLDKVYFFLEENMNAYIREYGICCPAPTGLSITTIYSDNSE